MIKRVVIGITSIVTLITLMWGISVIADEVRYGRSRENRETVCGERTEDYGDETADRGIGERTRSVDAREGTMLGTVGELSTDERNTEVEDLDRERDEPLRPAVNSNCVFVTVIGADDEQATSEKLDKVADKELGKPETRVEILETEQSQDETLGEGINRHNGFVALGIWSGAYWHFTPEQIDNQWSGMKSSKPVLPEGTTRAWQKYLYEKLAEIGAEHFYRIAVAQAMQESGFNPLNQQGNNAVPDKGLFSFRIWYWDNSYGDIYDYHANIDAYVSRITPYLSDRSEQGIYRAISQHYQPDGTIHMDYVNYVLGRLNELWEVE